MKSKRLKVPETVLTRAKAAASTVPVQKPQPPELPKVRRTLAREKVVAALKKLHPMD